MSDPRNAPYGSVRVADVDILAEVAPGNPNINDCAFHLVRRHFDVQAFGVNAATGNAGDEMIEEHHEADDEENETNGHQELFDLVPDDERRLPLSSPMRDISVSLTVLKVWAASSACSLI